LTPIPNRYEVTFLKMESPLTLYDTRLRAIADELVNVAGLNTHLARAITHRPVGWWCAMISLYTLTEVKVVLTRHE
jgi:hypothetical protein